MDAPTTKLEGKLLTDELWREYDLGSGQTYTIHNPVTLFVGKTTHRVVDQGGLVHCVPFPLVGDRAVILRWRPIDPANPVQF